MRNFSDNILNENGPEYQNFDLEYYKIFRLFLKFVYEGERHICSYKFWIHALILLGFMTENSINSWNNLYSGEKITETRYSSYFLEIGCSMQFCKAVHPQYYLWNKMNI